MPLRLKLWPILHAMTKNKESLIFENRSLKDDVERLRKEIKSTDTTRGLELAIIANLNKTIDSSGEARKEDKDLLMKYISENTLLRSELHRVIHRIPPKDPGQFDEGLL